MDRREFIKSGAVGAAGLALGAVVPFLTPAAVDAACKLQSEKGKLWKFGVMADTQWGKNADNQNPGTCALDIVNLINAEFVKRDVKFVIQVGDLIDQEDDAVNGLAGLRNMPVRADAAKTLYDNGIGFYPLRGNHEGSVTGANEFVKLYPQSRGFGHHVFGADHFSSPAEALDGLSYSFDFCNVRFVMLDQFVRADGTGYLGRLDGDVNSNIIDQQSWIDGQLSTKPSQSHALVLGHKNLIGQNHVDCLFGADPSQNPASRNAFISSLASRGVRYYLGGHDHMHHRSIITSPDGSASVKQMICSSDSYKFYYPAKPSNDAHYDVPMREISAAQELDTFGYYVFTVDGPRVTVDFYSSTIGMPFGAPIGNESKLVNSPTQTAFFKRESFGYSLNGREFLVAEGGSYTAVQDSFKGTTARVLAGTNQGVATDASGRSLTKTVNTGWAAPGTGHDDAPLASNVLTLWGMADSLSLWNETLGLGPEPSADSTEKGDTFALSIAYDQLAAHGAALNGGHFGIGTRTASGKWINAVAGDFGGTKKFVFGPWNSSYTLGTYGVDTGSKTAWAVINYDGDFAVTPGL